MKMHMLVELVKIAKIFYLFLQNRKFVSWKKRKISRTSPELRFTILICITALIIFYKS